MAKFRLQILAGERLEWMLPVEQVQAQEGLALARLILLGQVVHAEVPSPLTPVVTRLHPTRLSERHWPEEGLDDLFWVPILRAYHDLVVARALAGLEEAEHVVELLPGPRALPVDSLRALLLVAAGQALLLAPALLVADDVHGTAIEVVGTEELDLLGRYDEAALLVAEDADGVALLWPRRALGDDGGRHAIAPLGAPRLLAWHPQALLTRALGVVPLVDQDAGVVQPVSRPSRPEAPIEIINDCHVGGIDYGIDRFFPMAVIIAVILTVIPIAPWRKVLFRRPCASREGGKDQSCSRCGNLAERPAHTKTTAVLHRFA